MDNEDVFHIGVKVLIINQEGYLLLLCSVPNDGKEMFWDIPGGRIQRGETIFDTLNRELYEETGLRLQGKEVKFVQAKLSNTRITVRKDNDVGLLFLIYRCVWNEAPLISMSSEHSCFQWVDPKEAIQNSKQAFWASLAVWS